MRQRRSDGQIAAFTGALGTIAVVPLAEVDLPAADRIMRLAFGTFLGLPKPEAFMGDAGYVRTRWRSDPSAAFGASVEEDNVTGRISGRHGSPSLGC